MPNYLKILVPTITLCFVIGVFWGLNKNTPKKSYLGDLKILAPFGSFSKEFIRQFEESYDIKINLTELNLFNHQVEVKTRFKNYDLVWVNHSMAKQITGLYRLNKLPIKTNKNVSPDFNFLVSEENSVLPYRWRVYLYQSNSKKELSLKDIRDKRDIRVKLKINEVDTMLAMSYLGLLKQSWVYDENIERIKKAIKRFIYRSRDIKKEDNKTTVISQTSFISNKNKLNLKKDFLDINYLAMPLSKKNNKAKHLFLERIIANTASLLNGTDYSTPFYKWDNSEDIKNYQKAKYIKDIDLSEISLYPEMTLSEKIWSQAFAEAVN